MKKPPAKTVEEYLALIVRRRWWIVVPFAALTCAIALFTYILPRNYVSETLILIRPRDVPEDFVKDLIVGTTEQRLSAIEQTVLSRTNLVQILNEFEDRLPEYRGLNMDQKVLKLHNQIHVTFEVEKRMGVQLPVTYFRIAYQNQSPDLAQRIATKVTSLFIEQDNRARELQVFGTTEFLTGELQKAATQLNESEQHLKQLKERWRYELPDQLETNLRTLDRLGLQKQANAEALDRYATIRLNLERQISEMSTVIPRDAAPVGFGSNVAIANPLVPDYRKAAAEYEQLEAKYTSKHPDVQAALVRLDRIKKSLPVDILSELEKESSTAVSATVPNPLYQNLTAQLQEVKTEFDIREREKRWIESEIARFSRRVQNAPQSEQELASAMRLNADLNGQYEDLKKKVGEASLSESLESRQKGSQFVIVDPANYPLVPTKPMKWAVLLAGMLFALPISFGFGFAADVMNQRIWTQKDIENRFAIPVLAEIPQIVSTADFVSAGIKRRRHMRLSLAAAAVYSLGLYLLYANQSAVLRGLDPIIQRLMY